MPPRKRTRKRKRRNVSSSSSSSLSSSDSDTPKKTVESSSINVAGRPAIQNDEDSDSESSSSSSSATSSIKIQGTANTQDSSRKAPPSRSPTPPSTAIPPLLPPKEAQSAVDIEKEKELKDKFREFWMTSIADGFSDDLEEIRKEPNMTQSRLSMLIDSLAAGAEVFEKDEMESALS